MHIYNSKVYKKLLLPIIFLIASINLTKAQSSDLDKLQLGYNQYIQSIQKDKNNYYILMKNGKKISFPINQKKSFSERLANPTLDDVFSIYYPYEKDLKIPPQKNEDPGRFRPYKIFDEVYGDTEQKVKSNLVEIKWLPTINPTIILFNKQNGAADALKKVSDELDKETDPEVINFLKNNTSSYYWRIIAGTNRKSPHSYGIAIDIFDQSLDSYWIWSLVKSGKVSKEDSKDESKMENILVDYHNNVPEKVIKVFEKYGFIWGGKWYHFDLMHFEYRPEFLHKKI